MTKHDDSSEVSGQNSPPLMTIRAAARALGICVKTVWSITKPRGTLPCVRIGRAVRYALDDITRWIELKKQN